MNPTTIAIVAGIGILTAIAMWAFKEDPEEPLDPKEKRKRRYEKILNGALKDWLKK